MSLSLLKIKYYSFLKRQKSPQLTFFLNNFLLVLGGRFLIEEHNGHTLHMGAQWVHGVCEDNAMFKLAEKYGLLENSMERDGFGDMNHESFDLEHVYLKVRR
jgi:hypothetical protein